MFLYLDQGTTFSANVPISNNNTANVDVDLASFQARSKFRRHYSSVNSHSIGATIHVNNAVVMLSMNAATSANIADGRYMFDVEIFDSGGVVYRIAEGILTVTPEVTR